MTPDINIMFRDMPTTIQAFHRDNPDNSCTIVINTRFDHETQIKAYNHELEHIRNDDISKLESVQRIESIAHGIKQLENERQEL